MNFPSAIDSKLACQNALALLSRGDRQPMIAWLRGHLFEHVLPFWDTHAIDDQGGLFTCLGDSGAILSTDKWLWSQWRAVWVYSRIHNHLDRDSRWIKQAQNIADFCCRHGWDDRANGWVQTLSREGKVLRGYESIYVDAFAVYGLAEFYLATGDLRMRELACRTADAALTKLSRPYDTIPHFPYPIPKGAKPHGIPMLWSLTLAELGRAVGEEKYLAAAAGLSREIFRDFYRPDRDLILEIVRLDGREFTHPQGTAVVPGHVIEDMWFQIHLTKLLGLGRERSDEACRMIRRHLEFGWDPTLGGGLLLAVDAAGRQPVGWGHADAKLWWPHTEALYATLLAWEHTGDRAFFGWHKKIWQLCLDHYADWKHGEWRQKLSRSLQPMDATVALPVKDPFHLPRSLILQIELLETRPTPSS
jgi:N-acylglucosamine 2-epimerase